MSKANGSKINGTTRVIAKLQDIRGDRRESKTKRINFSLDLEMSTATTKRLLILTSTKS